MRLAYVGCKLSLFHGCKLSLAKILFVALEHNTPDLSQFCVGNIQRAIGSHGDTHRAVFRVTYVDDRIHHTESVCENFERSGRLSVFEGNKSDKITCLRIRRAVRGAVKGDERTVLVSVRELVSLVEIEIVGCPVSGKSDEWFLILVAVAYDSAITAILRCEQFLPFDLVVIAVWPPRVCTFFEPEKFLRRKLRALPGVEQVGPQPQKVVSSMLYRV